MTGERADGLADIDRDAVGRYWERIVAAQLVGSAATLADAFQFGDAVEMADQLLALVTDGPKRATASCRLEYADDGHDLPSVGDLAVVCDGRGSPRAVIRTTDVRVGSLASVDDSFAWDEGEGDRSRDDWLEMHARYFSRVYPAVWGELGDDFPVVFERFELVCREPGTAR
jgi:uncharacterized protein YhfF